MLLRGDNIQNRSQAGGESRRFFQADGKRLATMSGNGEYGGAAFASWFFPSVFLDLTFWCSLFCQGWAHCSHFKKKYALCGVHSPVPPLLDQSHMKGPTLDLTGGSFRATLHFPDPLRWTLWLGRKAKVTLSTGWQPKGTQGHNLVLWVAGGQFDPSINWPGLLSCASTWRCLKRRISGFSKSVSKANASQGHFLSLESRQAWSLPSLCILRAARWDTAHAVTVPAPSPPVTLQSAKPTYMKEYTTLPLQPLTGEQRKRPLEAHPFEERTELSVKNPKHPTRKSQTTLKSENKTTKSWQRVTSISSNPHLSF